MKTRMGGPGEEDVRGESICGLVRVPKGMPKVAGELVGVGVMIRDSGESRGDWRLMISLLALMRCTSIVGRERIEWKSR